MKGGMNWENGMDIYTLLCIKQITNENLLHPGNSMFCGDLNGKGIQKRGDICISSVQSLSHVPLFATPWIAARQASLSITNSQSSLRLTSIKSVMPSSHLILCRPLLLMPPILPSIRVFSNESTLHMRWPEYWSSSFSIIPSKEIPGLISFRNYHFCLLWCCLQIISLFLVLYPKTILYQRYHYPLMKKTRFKEIGSLSKN